MVMGPERSTRSPGKVTNEAVRLPVKLLGGVTSITLASGASIWIMAAFAAAGATDAGFAAAGLPEFALRGTKEVARGVVFGGGAGVEEAKASVLERESFDIEPAIADRREAGASVLGRTVADDGGGAVADLGAGTDELAAPGAGAATGLGAFATLASLFAVSCGAESAT
jgi:hypothetical protein